MKHWISIDYVILSLLCTPRKKNVCWRKFSQNWAFPVFYWPSTKLHVLPTSRSLQRGYKSQVWHWISFIPFATLIMCKTQLLVKIHNHEAMRSPKSPPKWMTLIIKEDMYSFQSLLYDKHVDQPTVTDLKVLKALFVCTFVHRCVHRVNYICLLHI